MNRPELASCIAALQPFPYTLASLLADVTPDEARRRGPAGQWAIVEIINHLADEESEDFRQRVRLTLEDPQQEWPGIDPQNAVRERNHIGRDSSVSIGRFTSEREASVAWLRTLDVRPADWSAVHPHPQWPTCAGDSLAAWLAHDMLHLRQIAKRRIEITTARAGGFNPAYAGQLPE